MWADALLFYLHFHAKNSNCLRYRTGTMCDPTLSSVSLPPYTSRAQEGFHIPPKFKIQPHCTVLGTFHSNRNRKDFAGVWPTQQASKSQEERVVRFLCWTFVRIGPHMIAGSPIPILDYFNALPLGHPHWAHVPPLLPLFNTYLCNKN